MTLNFTKAALFGALAILGSAPLVAGECEKLDRIPPSAQKVHSEALTVAQNDTFSREWKFESRASKTYVRLEGTNGLWSIYHVFPGGNPLCTVIGSSSGLPATFLLENPSTTK